MFWRSGRIVLFRITPGYNGIGLGKKDEVFLFNKVWDSVFIQYRDLSLIISGFERRKRKET
jgi:hypothetical protein